MKFNPQMLISRGYWAPAGENGSDTGSGSTPDRGDEPGGEVKSPLDGAGKTAETTETDETASKKDGETVTETEGEETAEEKAEREAAEAAEAAKKRIRIPKARFDEALNKARARENALLEQIEQLKGGQQARVAQQAVSERRSKITELQDKYEDLIIDGKKEEARKVRTQIEQMRDDLYEYQTAVKTDEARQSAVEELTYNAKLAGLEAQYPALNPDHSEYDEERTNEVGSLLTALIKSGTKRAVALERAVRYVLGAAPTAAAAGTTAADKEAHARAEEARRKAADASKRQPAAMKDVGRASDSAGGAEPSGVDVLKMSQAQFSKLDEETKSRLRGDTL